VRLSASRCSIGENGGIVSVKYTIEEASTGSFIHFALGRVLVEDAVKAECLILDTLSVGDDALGEFVDGVVFRWVEDTGRKSVPRRHVSRSWTYRHLSSMTLTTGLMPFWVSFGVGTPAREPSPRNSGPSSHFASCAASRIVNGRTLTVTEIDDAPLEPAIM